MLDNAIPQGFEDAVELRRKNRETVVKYMNTKGQDRLRRHELFVEDGCAQPSSTKSSWRRRRSWPLVFMYFSTVARFFSRSSLASVKPIGFVVSGIVNAPWR